MRRWNEARERLIDLWRRALQEHCEPREIGVAVGLGLFACCSPLLGFHSVIAIALATLFRVNRLWALVFSQASIFGLLRAPIVFAEVQTSHRLRTGEWLTVSLASILHHAPSLVLDWGLGAIPVGGGISLAGGLVAYFVAKKRARRASRVTSDTLAPPLARSSESSL